MKTVTLSFVFRGMKAKTSLKRDYLALCWRWKIKFPLLSLSPRSNSLFLSASRCSCVERSSEESPDPVVGKSPAVDTRSCRAAQRSHPLAPHVPGSWVEGRARRRSLSAGVTSTVIGMGLHRRLLFAVLTVLCVLIVYILALTLERPLVPLYDFIQRASGWVQTFTLNLRYESSLTCRHLCASSLRFWGTQEYS